VNNSVFPVSRNGSCDEAGSRACDPALAATYTPGGPARPPAFFIPHPPDYRAALRRAALVAQASLPRRARRRLSAAPKHVLIVLTDRPFGSDASPDLERYPVYIPRAPLRIPRERPTTWTLFALCLMGLLAMVGAEVWVVARVAEWVRRVFA
jgi:hypothetical protein